MKKKEESNRVKSGNDWLMKRDWFGFGFEQSNKSKGGMVLIQTPDKSGTLIHLSSQTGHNGIESKQIRDIDSSRRNFYLHAANDSPKHNKITISSLFLLY